MISITKRGVGVSIAAAAAVILGGCGGGGGGGGTANTSTKGVSYVEVNETTISKAAGVLASDEWLPVPIDLFGMFEFPFSPEGSVFRKSSAEATPELKVLKAMLNAPGKETLYREREEDQGAGEVTNPCFYSGEYTEHYEWKYVEDANYDYYYESKSYTFNNCMHNVELPIGIVGNDGIYPEEHNTDMAFSYKGSFSSSMEENMSDGQFRRVMNEQSSGYEFTVMDREEDGTTHKIYGVLGDMSWQKSESDDKELVTHRLQVTMDGTWKEMEYEQDQKAWESNLTAQAFTLIEQESGRSRSFSMSMEGYLGLDVQYYEIGSGKTTGLKRKKYGGYAFMEGLTVEWVSSGSAESVRINGTYGNDCLGGKLDIKTLTSWLVDEDQNDTHGYHGVTPYAGETEFKGNGSQGSITFHETNDTNESYAVVTVDGTVVDDNASLGDMKYMCNGRGK